jgi:hypothetical protein
MHEGFDRPRAQTTSERSDAGRRGRDGAWRNGERRGAGAHRGRERRPDRVALWAVFLSIFSMVVAATTAQATGGGVVVGGGGGVATDAGSGAGARFGTRVLRKGMEGADVKILNGIVKAKSYAAGVRLVDRFGTPTAATVKQFQRYHGLAADGVVGRSTSRALVRSMDIAGATWYGPGFYGNRTACGQVLRTTTLGVAHRKLPCGTKVTFAYRGRYAIARVIDRGPYTAGYRWDLTAATARALGFAGSDDIRFAVAR